MRGHPGFPARPLLRPGVRVSRRSDTELQVGLDRRLAVVAPESPSVREVLDGLRHGTPPRPPELLDAAAVRLCDALLAKRLVVDADDWLPLLRDADAEQRSAVTAVVADHGSSAAALLAHRRRLGVEVVSAGLDEAAGRCRSLLATAGLATAGPATAGLATAGPASPGQGSGPDLVLHLAATEPDRELVDEWMRADRPHLVLSAAEGFLRIGPFVHPGRTACLRCVDAHLAEQDPRRGLVVRQYVEAGTGGLPVPLHVDLLDLAIGWVVRDVVSWADGVRPATWSTTVEVDPRLDLPRTPWRPHPACGCTWGVAAVG